MVPKLKTYFFSLGNSQYACMYLGNLFYYLLYYTKLVRVFLLFAVIIENIIKLQSKVVENTQ